MVNTIAKKAVVVRRNFFLVVLMFSIVIYSYIGRYMICKENSQITSPYKAMSKPSCCSDTEYQKHTKGNRFKKAKKARLAKVKRQNNQLLQESEGIAEQLGFDLKKTGLTRQPWLQYFPDTKDMIINIESMDDFPTKEQMTSLKTTKVYNIQQMENGEKLKAMIQARDHLDMPKRYGGDYFRARLTRDGSASKGAVSCVVNDNRNGTYGIECYVPWTGNVFLEIELVNPSENLYLVILSSNQMSDPAVLKNTSFMNSHGKREYGICDMNLRDNYRSRDICDYSNKRNGEPWFCVKPPSGECNPIERQLRKTIDTSKIKMIGHRPYHSPIYENMTIGNSPLKLFVQDSQKLKSENLMPACSRATYKKPSSNPAKASGWVEGERWRPFHCSLESYNEKKFKNCARNKFIFLIGDSTIHQWLKLFSTIFKMPLKEYPDEVWATPQVLYGYSENVTLYYRGHGPPFHAAGPPILRPYISDTLNSITTPGKDTIVIFNIGIHMGRYSPGSFIHRLNGIKRSLNKLRARLPGVAIFLKGLHPNKPWAFQISPWIAYRHEVLLRNLFKSMKGLIFLDYWDMFDAIRNAKVHISVRKQYMELQIFQSYLCQET